MRGRLEAEMRKVLFTVLVIKKSFILLQYGFTVQKLIVNPYRVEVEKIKLYCCILGIDLEDFI